jgi:hypothetical protein
LLKRLARKHDCAILLLAHPSLTGLNTGSGMSGSTGWNNAVRFSREDGGRISRPFCRADVAALRVDPLQKAQKHVIRFYFGGHFVEAGFTLNGDEKAVFPFERDLAASLAVVRFLTFKRAQVLVGLCAIACFCRLEIEARSQTIMTLRAGFSTRQCGGF